MLSLTGREDFGTNNDTNKGMYWGKQDDEGYVSLGKGIGLKPAFRDFTN